LRLFDVRDGDAEWEAVPGSRELVHHLGRERLPVLVQPWIDGWLKVFIGLSRTTTVTDGSKARTHTGRCRRCL
jgi:hypothetical protein